MASKKVTTKSTAGVRKVATQVACYKCQSIIDSKDAIICSLCKNTYEFDCAGFSEKLYRLMKKDTRKTWKCKQCIHPNNTLNVSDSNHCNINIRKRLHKILPDTDSVAKTVEIPVTPPLLQLELSSQSYDSQILDSEASSPEKLSRSFDHTMRHHNETTRIEELREEVKRLKLDLMSTQNEFENTIIENNELKKQINKLTSDIDTLKSLCQTPPMTKNNSKKKRKSLVNTLNSSVDKNTEVEHLQRKIINLEKELLDMEKFIKELNTQIEILRQESNEFRNVKNTTIRIQEKKHTRNIEKSNNIYIFGDQQASGWSANLIQIRSREPKNIQNYTIFGSIKPAAVTKNVLTINDNIERNTNKDDYVVISIGSNDCNPTKLIADLTIALNKLSNTNVIVTSVDKNPHLNEKMLNNTIKTLLTCFDNSCYVDLTRYSSSVGKAHALNKYINTRDYNKTYLNYNTRKFRMLNTYSITSTFNRTDKIDKIPQPNKSQTSSQTKITDYFNRITTGNSGRYCDSSYSERNSNNSLFRG